MGLGGGTRPWSVEHHRCRIPEKLQSYSQVIHELVQQRKINCYRPQRSCGQGYVFTGVCDSVHRGGVSGEPPRTRQTPPRTRQTPPDQGEPPPGRRLQHTVNERPVRILLECNLVKHVITQ